MVAVTPRYVFANHLDDNGDPAGGTVTGRGIEIRWQNGPLGRGTERQEPNGAFVEDVLEACVMRLKHYQTTKFSCRENALAITHVEEAIHWLRARTQSREEHEVEGTNEQRPALDGKQ